MLAALIGALSGQGHTVHRLSSHQSLSTPLASLCPQDGSHPDSQTQGEWGSSTLAWHHHPPRISLHLLHFPVPLSQLLLSSLGPTTIHVFCCCQLILGPMGVNSPETTAMACFRCQYLLRMLPCTSPRQNESFWITDKGSCTSK